MPSEGSKRTRKDILKGTHQLLAYADDNNIMGENKVIIQKITVALSDTSKEVGLEVNLEKTKYMLISHCNRARRNHSIKIATRSSEGVAKFNYLGSTLTDQNYMQDKIKSRLNSGNACYHSVQSLLSSCLLS
jgi:hypothetical protein